LHYAYKTTSLRTPFWQGGKIGAAAQRQLFEQYGERLYRVAYRYLGEKMAAEDATAEAMVKIFAALPQLRFEHINQFEAWLRRIVINQSLMRIRQRKRWKKEHQTTTPLAHGGEADMLEVLSLKEVLQLIQQLPEGYKTVLQLYVFEGYSHAEIATALGISTGTSKSQLSKARQFLQANIDKLNSV
jgi:RNA polymerase sigma-70 factor (ECF subfamily)